MNVTFAIYEDAHYTIQTPYGSRTVIQHKKIDSTDVDIPDEHMEEIEKHYIFNTEIYYEGIGAVPVQDPETGNIYPQTIKFLFAEEIKDKNSAFKRFDEFLNKKIEEFEKRHEEQQNVITTATEQDLHMIDEFKEQAGPGGIIIP